MKVAAGKNTKYILVLVTTLALIVLIEILTPQPINWSPSFSKRDKIPYGNYILFELLPDLFPNKKIVPVEQPIYTVLGDTLIRNSNYIFINQNFFPDEAESKKLLEFVAAGNNIFIAAHAVKGLLADSLKVGTDVIMLERDSVRINFTNPNLKSVKNYEYQKGTAAFYFSSFDSSNTVALGENNRGKINFIRTRFGRGAFYLNSIPFAFTNYNMVSHNNAEYVFKALSYLPIESVFWDEFYKPGRRIATTPLRFILNQAALKWAYYTTIAAILLFIIFEGKRKQRIIPVIKPLVNTTVEFVETVARLYYQKRDHKNLAKKKITYFFDHVRKNDILKTGQTRAELMKKVSEKSGLNLQEVEALFVKIAAVEQKPQISARELMALNVQIDKFYECLQ